MHGLLRDTLDFLSTASFSNDDEDAMEEDFEDGECITDTVIFVNFSFNYDLFFSNLIIVLFIPFHIFRNNSTVGDLYGPTPK